MDGQSKSSRKAQAELRERWMKRAAAAYERMFGKANQEQLVTFTEREDMACALGDELAAFLLEEHAAGDAQVRPSNKSAVCCPKCQKPGRRLSKRNEKLPERPLTTRAGEITLRRERWECTSCRILFFSVGPQAGVGDGGIQSADTGKGGTASDQGAVVRGSE